MCIIGLLLRQKGQWTSVRREWPHPQDNVESKSELKALLLHFNSTAILNRDYVTLTRGDRTILSLLFTVCGTGLHSTLHLETHFHVLWFINVRYTQYHIINVFIRGRKSFEAFMLREKCGSAKSNSLQTFLQRDI